MLDWTRARARARARAHIHARGNVCIRAEGETNGEGAFSRYRPLLQYVVADLIPTEGARLDDRREKPITGTLFVRR